MRKRIRKYVEGGTIPYAQLGQVAGGIYDNLTPVDEYGIKPGQGKNANFKSDFNAGASGALKGAGTGASIGLALAPLTGGLSVPVGAAIGGVVGAVGGVRKNNQAQEFGTEQERLFAQQEDIKNRARLQNYDQVGSNNNQIYAKYGGAIPVKYFNGGNLTPLSEESQEVQGNMHEQGGVDIAPGIEVEGGETLKGDFVFSEELGFAQRHKPLARAIGKMEKKVPNTITNNTIQILKQKEEALKQEQEGLKQQLGITPTNEFEFGGDTNPGDSTIVKPYVPLDPTKRFLEKSAHDKYYDDLARTKFKGDSVLQSTRFGNTMKGLEDTVENTTPIDYNTAVVLGGGLPAWARPAPQRIVYKSSGIPMQKVGVRQETVKQGFNTGRRLGVKTIK